MDNQYKKKFNCYCSYCFIVNYEFIIHQIYCFDLLIYFRSPHFTWLFELLIINIFSKFSNQCDYYSSKIFYRNLFDSKLSDNHFSSFVPSLFTCKKVESALITTKDSTIFEVPRMSCVFKKSCYIHISQPINSRGGAFDETLGCDEWSVTRRSTALTSAHPAMQEVRSFVHSNYSINNDRQCTSRFE